ncbi:MAG: MFS transporter [Acidobacteriia bacterium]|nr:MFS transporter [Terriglobia bacterium]MBV8902085.1 MFS transporter [Terriglobia bacterium]
MAPDRTSPATAAARSGMFVTGDGRNVALTFILISSLFLLWGFCNGLIDVMDKHFQEELGLTKAQSAWVQFAHYLGYFLMSVPAGWLAARIGYKGGIIAGLLIVAVGGFWFVPATALDKQAALGGLSPQSTFAAYLAGVCIIATGLTFLETVANPYATVLGDRRYAATRINLAQSLNGFGWIFGPAVGSVFFYSVDASGRRTGSQRLYIPYLAIAAVVLVLAVIFYLARVPDIKAENEHEAGSSGSRSFWSEPHFCGAVAAQFFYVAAQAGIFSFFINYMTEQTPPIPLWWESTLSGSSSHAGLLGSWLEGWLAPIRTGTLAISDKGAANLASFAFLFFIAGRFTGAMLLKKIPAHRGLAFYAIANVAATLLVFLKLGWLSVACVFLTYFFMSIMFPTIFALGIFGLGARAKRASSYIVMAIVGGALVPKLMGYIADRYDMSRGFAVPMLCFALVALYGFCWPKLRDQS